jgi:hypothetical protein
MSPRPYRSVRRVAIVAIVSAVLVAGCGTSSHQRKAGVGADNASEQSLARCVASWNEQITTRNGPELAEIAAEAVGDTTAPTGMAPVAIGVYSGPTEQVERAGAAVTSGPSMLSVSPGVCLVMAGTQVFIQQPDGSFGDSEGILTYSFAFLADGTWAQTHANAQVYYVGIAGGGPGNGQITTSTSGPPITITADMVAGQPSAASASRTSTQQSTTSAAPLASGRHLASATELAAITLATGTGYPARCSLAYISTINPSWASWGVPGRLPSGCPPPGDGVIVLHAQDGQWATDSEASAGGCAEAPPEPTEPHIPVSVAHGLGC